MRTSAILSSVLLGAVKLALANNALPRSAFTNNNGSEAAQGAAPMWYLPSGTCMPSAAEDGHGHQTNGVDSDNCNINKLSNGCPTQPQWTGMNTFYGNVAGEPWGTIPTYWKVQQCGNQYKVIYYVYFKKDTGHKSDWEGIVVAWTSHDGGNTYVRDAVALEQDGKHVWVGWGDINDTFDGWDDWQNWLQKNRNHPKIYFGKWHHSAHVDWHDNSFKNTCPPDSASDFRNADYQFWAYNNLRPTYYLQGDWNWGKATAPNYIDVCAF